jgi:cytochrome c oxidase subunit 2
MVVLMKKLVLLPLFSLALAQDPASRKPDTVIAISAERFVFSPSRVTVHQGELVEFVLSSEDTDHGFRVQAAGIDLTIPPQGKGESRVRFWAREKGEFMFECSRACGAGHNLMRGILVVK